MLASSLHPRKFIPMKIKYWHRFPQNTEIWHHKNLHPYGNVHIYHTKPQVFSSQSKACPRLQGGPCYKCRTPDPEEGSIASRNIAEGVPYV